MSLYVPLNWADPAPVTTTFAPEERRFSIPQGSSSTAVVFSRCHSSSSLITPSRSPALPAGVFVAHCSASQPSLRDVMHGSAPRDSRNATMSLRWYSYIEHSEQGCESGVRFSEGATQKVQRFKGPLPPPRSAVSRRIRGTRRSGPSQRWHGRRPGGSRTGSRKIACLLAQA